MTSPRTLLGPLTTTWTPPGVCTLYMATCGTCTTAWQGQTCNPSSNAHDWTDCWPPRASSIPDPGVFMGWGLYSPGIVCPAGFTTVAMATAGGSTGWAMEYELGSGETAAACCPTGFTCSGIETLSTYGQTCVLTVTSASFSTVQCDSGAYSDFSLVTFPRTANGAVQSSFVLFAPLIQINFQSSDLPKTTASPGQTSSATPAPGSSSGQTVTVSATGGVTSFPIGPTSAAPVAGSPGSGSGSGSPSSSSSSSSSSPSGLSLGAKIGIGVGSGVGAIVLGLLLVLLYRAWQRRQQTTVVAEGESARDKMWPRPQQAELGGQEVQELEGSQPPQEIGPRASKWKRSGGPAFKVASPSAARGSGPEDMAAAGPFELEADTPSISTTAAATTPPRPRTPVIFSPPTTAPDALRVSSDYGSPTSSTAPRHSRELVSPTTPTAPRRPLAPTAPMARELHPDDI